MLAMLLASCKTDKKTETKEQNQTPYLKTNGSYFSMAKVPMAGEPTTERHYPQDGLLKTVNLPLTPNLAWSRITPVVRT